jgi:hypothetical protein
MAIDDSKQRGTPPFVVVANGGVPLCFTIRWQFFSKPSLPLLFYVPFTQLDWMFIGKTGKIVPIPHNLDH